MLIGKRVLKAILFCCLTFASIGAGASEFVLQSLADVNGYKILPNKSSRSHLLLRIPFECVKCYASVVESFASHLALKPEQLQVYFIVADGNWEKARAAVKAVPNVKKNSLKDFYHDPFARLTKAFDLGEGEKFVLIGWDGGVVFRGRVNDRSDREKVLNYFKK